MRLLLSQHQFLGKRYCVILPGQVKAPQVFQEIYDFYSFDVLAKVFVLPAREQVCSNDKNRQAGFTGLALIF